METLVPIALPPGFYRNGTIYQAKNRWINGHLVRWFEGALRPIGGWVQATDINGAQIQVTGFPRCACAWRKNDATAWLAVGTTGTPSKLYAYSNGTLTDITPAGLTNGNADGSQFGSGLGWGLGGWGIAPWGGGGGVGIIDADTWSLDNFGEILLACLTADGKIYESTPTTQATQVTNSPTGCRAVTVTPERFVFALGASSDPRLVKWSDQGNRTTWTAAAGNQAGSFPLQTGGRIQAGRRTDRETLLFTDADVWAAIYVGGNLIYSFVRRGDNCGLIGPNAVAIADGVPYWMADGRFFSYPGAVRPVPCEVSDYVFGDLNRVQKAKIAAFPNPAFGEVTWHYPSASQAGSENDRYVTLNYQAGYWMTGNLGRAAVTGPGVFSTPQAWTSGGQLYSHETGQNRGGELAFIESGPLELGDGERVIRLQSIVPDERILGQVQTYVYTAFQPLGAETTNGPYTLTEKTDLRLTARQIRIRHAETTLPIILANGAYTANGSQFAGSQNTNADFRIGSFRLAGIPGGYR